MPQLDAILLALKVGAAALLIWTAAIYRDHVYQLGYDAAVADRAAADALAVRRRTEENVVLAQHQGETNLKITEVKHEELAPVRERIVVERVRVGTAICGSAAPPDAESAASSDEADSAGRLVRPDAERDIVALKLEVEEHLATARACQATLRENGMAP